MRVFLLWPVHDAHAAIRLLDRFENTRRIVRMITGEELTLNP